MCAKLHARGLRPVNADITVIAQTPRLAPFIDAMRATIAADMQIGIESISVKATTSEQLGFTGRGEGIAALAVVLLEQPAAL